MISHDEAYTPHHNEKNHEKDHEACCGCDEQHEEHAASYEQSSDAEDYEEEASTQDQNNNDEHAQCRERIQQLEEQLAYLSSDFTNYRRNIEKEKTRWKQEAQSSVFQDLLTVVDDIDRAVADLESQDLPEDVAKRLEGIHLIYKSIRKLLEEYEVREITQVEEFDPQWHEAVMQVSETDVPSGNIVSVVQKGYTYKGELLRTAKVTVAA